MKNFVGIPIAAALVTCLTIVMFVQLSQTEFQFYWEATGLFFVVANVLIFVLQLNTRSLRVAMQVVFAAALLSTIANTLISFFVYRGLSQGIDFFHFENFWRTAVIFVLLFFTYSIFVVIGLATRTYYSTPE